MRRRFSLILGIAALVAFSGGLLASTSHAQTKGGKGKITVKAIQIYKDKGGKYRFRIKNDKGRVLANASKGYKTATEINEIVSSIRELAKTAKVSETAIKTKTALFEVYKDKGGKYRFRFNGEKGQKLAKSATGYKTKMELMNIIAALQQSVATAKIESKVN